MCEIYDTMPERFLELQKYVEGQPMPQHEFTKEQAFRRALSAGIPERMARAIIKYIWQGQPVGDFLQAVIANDLMDAACRADDVNIHLLKQYCKFFFNVAPGGCFGSRDIYTEWMKTGGLSGQNMEANKDKFN